MIIFITTVQAVFVDFVIVIQVITLTRAIELLIVWGRIYIIYTQAVCSSTNFRPVANAIALEVVIYRKANRKCCARTTSNTGNWRIQCSNTRIVAPGSICQHQAGWDVITYLYITGR